MEKKRSAAGASRFIPDKPDNPDERYFSVPNELIFHLHKFTPPAWMVYCVILKHAGNKTVAWPGLETMADLTGLSIPTIKRATAHLEAIGVLKRHAERGRVTRYILTKRLVPTKRSKLTSDPTVSSLVIP